MNPLDMIAGRDFDLLALDIRCNADRDGATVREIEVRLRGVKATYRVLAHDTTSALEAAELAFREEMKEKI